MKKIAVLGLGIIGMAWARNLHADGFEVRGWNRSPKPDEPFFVPDVLEAIRGAELIIVILADPKAVESVLEQILPHLQPEQMVAQASTISADWTKKFAAAVEKTGARFVETPFTGSKPAVEQRKTVFYLGGDPARMEEVRPVLELIGQKLLHIGPLGTASTLKLAVNLNLGIMAQGLAESLTLARTHGIADDTFFSALHDNAGRSGFSDGKEAKYRGHDYAPQFSAKLLGKDLRLALETAGALDLPATRIVSERLQEATDRGWGDDDMIGAIRLLDGDKKK